eukprot:gene3448-14071_t
MQILDLRKFEVEMHPSPKELWARFGKGFGTFFVGMVIWTIITWLPSFLVNIIFTGKMSDDALTLLTIALNILLGYLIYKQGSAASRKRAYK